MSRRKPVEVFDDWAKQGKDEGMEIGHAAAAGEMLALALERRIESSCCSCLVIILILNLVYLLIRLSILTIMLLQF